MTLLMWRQHRNQVIFASASLLVFAAVVFITGSTMASTYHDAAKACSATASCGQLGNDLFRGDGAIVDLIALTVVVPALLGLFWGAPLIAREMEDGTHKLAWMQAVTRQRWFVAKVTGVVAAAAVWGATISALVMWWSRPENSLHQYRFEPAHFDVQGLAPIGYAVFAVALGIAAGSLLRRTLPALAATAGVFVAVRLSVALWIRPHYLAPLQQALPLFRSQVGSGSNWVISSLVQTPNGRAGRSLNLEDMPVVCRQTVQQRGQFDSCLSAHGYHQIVTYQPAHRFWTFQAFEFGLFVVLAAALVVVAFFLVTRRDA